MLPKGDDAEDMEQSTLNNVFNLFGKGITQMLQQSVNQQTVIDELRAQNRSLQAQITNLTASLDEVEDRIFVKLQNVQPTLYTREGIPIDDALDTLSSKINSLNEKLTSNTDAISKFNAELTEKIDREEFEKTNNESRKVEDSFGELSTSIQGIQKDVQQIKRDAQDSNDRMIQTIKFQIQSQMLHQQMNSEEQDLTDYVTKDDLREKLNKLKIDLANASSGDQGDASSIVDLVLSGKGLTEEKVKEAYTLLQQRKANIDKNYAKQKKNVHQEMTRLMRLAKNVSRTNPNNGLDELEFGEEEEDKAENANNGKEDKDSQQKIEYRTVGVDTVKDIFEEENIETRQPNPRKKRKNVGITVKPPKKRKNKKNKDNNDTEEEDEEENEGEDDEEEQTTENKKSKQSKSKMNSKTIQNNENDLESLISKMQEEQEQIRQLQQQQQQQQVAPHVDESKIAQKVLEAVMPRIESLLVESLAGSSGGGIKLEKNEAKQLITQLSLLDSLKNEMKGLRVKINMKFDKTRAETELNARITKDEFFSYLFQIFPDNEALRGIAPQSKSKLPPLKNGRSSSISNSSNQSSINTNQNNNAFSNTYTSSNTYAATNATTSINNANSNSNMNTNISSNSNMNTNQALSSSLNGNFNNNNNIISTNNSSVNNNRNALAESQGVIYSKNSKPNNKGKMMMKPIRNSNMISLNQKYLKGTDGHYYFRDMGSDSNDAATSMFGTDKADDVDINAAFDFQPFRRVEESANVVKNIREETPNDVE